MLVKVQHQQKLRIKKPKLLRSNPLRKSLLLSGDDYGFLIDDEDIYVQYRRPEIQDKDALDDEELSDYVKFRLFLARQLALAKFRETKKSHLKWLFI